MTKKLACLTLGIACLIGAGVPAMAGGFDDDAGGLKDGIYDGVPVPAPQPIPSYEAEYYVRADLGYSFATESGATALGQGFTLHDGTLDGPYIVTLGMGRYITDNLRGELALDLRSSYKLGQTDQSYQASVRERATARGSGGPGGTNRHYYDVERHDEVRIGHYSGLVNLYYDFNNNSRFTPYLGGGVGLVVHTFRRQHSENATCNYSTNDTTGVERNYQISDTDATPACATGGVLPLGDSETNATDRNTYVTSSDKVSTGYGLTANVMAGFSFDIGNGKALDFNYRYVWMDGDVKLVTPALDQTSTVRIGDSTEHQLRVGVRMNIN